MKKQMLALRGIFLLTLLVWAAANEGQPKEIYKPVQEVSGELSLDQ
jgi:hypothetical protein